jgi:hypothetical protein
MGQQSPFLGTNSNHFEGKSFSEYSQGGITFSWGFDIELKRKND